MRIDNIISVQYIVCVFITASTVVIFLCEIQSCFGPFPAM